MEKLQEIKKKHLSEEAKKNFEKFNKYGLNFEEEVNYSISSIMNIKGLKSLETDSINQFLIDVASSGLTMNPSLNYSYATLRKRNDKVVLVHEITYQGMISRMSMLSDVQDVYAHVVFENDDFVGDLGLNPNLVHRPRYFKGVRKKDRGNPIGVYAVVVFNNEYRKFDFLPAERIEEIMSDSEDYKEDKKNNTAYSPWSNHHWIEMWAKTAIKHIYKYLPKSHLGIDLESSKSISETITTDNKTQGFEMQESIPAKKVATKAIDTIEDAAKAAVGLRRPLTALETIEYYDRNGVLPPTTLTTLEKQSKPVEEDFIKKYMLSEEGVSDGTEKITQGANSIPFKALSSEELQQMYDDKDSKKKLEKYAIQLGIFQDIVDNFKGKRLSKKVVFEGIKKHLKGIVPNPLAYNPTDVVNATGTTDSSPTFIKNEKPITSENEAQIASDISLLKKSIRGEGAKPFSKIVLRIIDKMSEPKDGARTEFTTRTLFSLVNEFDAGDDLTIKLKGADIFTFLSEKSNEEIKKFLQSVQ